MFTSNQIKALKFLIIVSKVGSDLAKRSMLFLIDHSEELTKEVCLSMVEGRKGFDEVDIRDAATMDAMNSSNCPTHLHEVMLAMGSKFHFHLHYGDFSPRRMGDKFNNDGQFAGWPVEKVSLNRNPQGLVKEGMPLRYTFWLSRESHSRKATFVPVSLKQLKKIKLTEPDLKYW